MTRQNKEIAFKFRVGELTLFTVNLNACILKTHFSEFSSQSIEDIQRDKLNHQQVVIIPSFPINCRLRRLSIVQGLIRYVLHQYNHYYVEISGTFDNYLKKFSSKTRSTLLRKVRKFKDFSQGEIRWHEYKDIDEVDEFYQNAWHISQKTYQERLLKIGLPQGDEYKEELKSLAATNSVRGYILFYERRPISYILAPILNNEIMLYQFVGFDPAYKKWSPGTVLQYLVLEKLFAGKSIRMFDFTEGEGQHKRFFSTSCQRCANVYFFKRNTKNRLIVLSHIGIDSLSSQIGKMLDAINLKSFVRTYVRFRSTKTVGS